MRTLLTSLALMLAVHSANAESPNGKLRFLFLTPFSEYEFFEPVKKGVVDAASAMEVETTFTGTPDGDVKTLAAMVLQGVKDGYDGIALNIIDPVAFDDVVAQAVRQGVPVIAFNVDDSRTPNARLAAIGQNMLQAGRTFGKAVERFIPKGSHVLLTLHDPNISALEERAAGAHEVLKSKHIVWTSLITGTEPTAAMEKVRAALAADPAIKIVLDTGSADTEAAGRAIEKYFPHQGYLSAGFDLSPEILRLIQAKIIRLTVDQQPYAQGYYSVVELTLLRRYGLAPASLDTGAVLITPDTVDDVIELSRKHYR